jgi:hypothetical protein
VATCFCETGPSPGNWYLSAFAKKTGKSRAGTVEGYLSPNLCFRGQRVTCQECQCSPASGHASKVAVSMRQRSDVENKEAAMVTIVTGQEFVS